MTRKTIENIETTTLNKVIRTKVAYNKGGINYATYAQDARGYYLHVTPITIEDGCESFMMFSGKKMLLKEVARYSDKAFRQVCLDVKDNPRYSAIVRSVAAEAGVVLKEG